MIDPLDVALDNSHVPTLSQTYALIAIALELKRFNDREEDIEMLKYNRDQIESWSKKYLT